MSMKRPKVRFTYRDYCLLPEDKRYELMDGELYMAPAPGSKHQQDLLNLAVLLTQFVREHGLGVIFIASLDVILSDEDVVQPDLLFVAQERRSIISERGCEGPPDLVVEVLSPSTAQRDRELKRKVYARYGVRQYWLVDPETQAVEVLGLDAEDLTPQGVYSRGEVVTSQMLPGLTLPVAQVFR